MENKDYLDFDEAVLFLKTTPSTLYKWLQAGKIPGHKLGRQWRFLKDELDIHVSGKGSKINMQKDFLGLTEILEVRSKTKESTMATNMNQLTEKILWDAFDHGSRLVHIYPAQGKFEISYRTKDGLQKLSSVQEDFFHEMDSSIQSVSTVVGDGLSRRMYLHRDEDDALQVRYQKIETVTGPRVTMRLSHPKKDILQLEKIVGNDEAVLKNFKKWLTKKSGIILITGANSSGKTTTVYSLLNEFRKQERVVFSIEETAELIMEGINQVELKSDRMAQFDSIFNQVYSSDPDVICLGLFSYLGVEDKVFNAAYKAATTGHVVIIQMDKPTCAEAYKTFKSHVHHPIEEHIIGISAQKLIEQPDGKLKCLYEFMYVFERKD